MPVNFVFHMYIINMIRNKSFQEMEVTMDWDNQELEVDEPNRTVTCPAGEHTTEGVAETNGK